MKKFKVRMLLSVVRTIVAIIGIVASGISLYLAMNWRAWSFQDQYGSSFFLFGMFMLIGIGGMLVSIYGLSPIFWQAILAEYGDKSDERLHDKALRSLTKWFVW